MMRLNSLVALLLLGCAATQTQAQTVIRVGSGAGCSSAGSNIQAAINGVTPVLGQVDIKIARNATYSAQQLDINGKNVRLIGGFADCMQASPDTTKTILNGVGGGNNSVITVRGNATVELHNLDIQSGDEVSDGFGGGVDIRDGGGLAISVYLENTNIINSNAGFGGGISITNSSPLGVPYDQSLARLTLGQKVHVNDNNARFAGGGIYCSNATLTMTSPRTAIFNNDAGVTGIVGTGGGLRLINCTAKIATQDGLFGTVSRNTATGNGGGISITGQNAKLDLYNLDPNRPTAILLNEAVGVGGGIEIGSSAEVNGYDIIIHDNTSRTGGGGVSVFDNDGDFCQEDRSYLILKRGLNGAPSGAVNCAANLDCNRVSNNVARSSGGTDMEGAAIRLEGVSSALTDSHGCVDANFLGTRISGNTGKTLVQLRETITLGVFDGVVIDDNTVSNVFDDIDGGRLEVLNSTIAKNTLLLGSGFGNTVFRRANGSMKLKRSVVWQPGSPLFGTDGSLSTNAVEFMLSQNFTNMSPNSTNRVVNLTELGFVDFNAGNYRFQPGSVAIDYATPSAGFTRDGFARNFDIPQVADEFGSQDVGAYEKQSAEGFNGAPVINVGGEQSVLEDRVGGTFPLQGFSLSDPNGDVVGALTITAPPGTGDLVGFSFTSVTATQIAANQIVLEGPVAQITDDTANFQVLSVYNPPAHFNGLVPIALSLSDQGNTGIGGALTAQATLNVNVIPVNDAPSLQIADLNHNTTDLGQQTVDLLALSTISFGPTIDETGQSVERWSDLTVSDPSGVLNGTPVLVENSGLLVFNLSGTPGVVQFSLRITDNGGTANGGVNRSAPASFQLQVNQVDDSVFSNGFE